MSDEFVFGDIEPEDAWDRGDDTLVLIVNLFQRLDLLDDGPPIGRYRSLLFEIEQRLRPFQERRDQLTERQRVRVLQLEEDLAFLRERDDNGE